MMRSVCLFLIVSILSLSSLGCFSSKWAMDDADYAEKYGRPYDPRPVRKWQRMGRQMIDARHVSSKTGAWVSVGASDFATNGVLGGELGLVHYSRPWLSGKLALTGQANSGADAAFLGGTAAVHVSPPTRVAPFVGFGGFLGGSKQTFDASHDGVDNNGDGVTDELGETDSTMRFMSAVYPEAGVHVWLTGSTRLTASASYWLTTEGRDHDFLFYGVGLTFGFGKGSGDSKPGPFRSEEEYLEESRSPVGDLSELDIATKPSSTSNKSGPLPFDDAIDRLSETFKVQPASNEEPEPLPRRLSNPW